jgi:hypothetical protein
MVGVDYRVSDLRSPSVFPAAAPVSSFLCSALPCYNRWHLQQEDFAAAVDIKALFTPFLYPDHAASARVLEKAG